MNKLMDAYNFRARLQPALLVLLPILFGLIAWLPNVKTLAEPLTAVAVSAGALWILMSIARDAGKKAEGILIAEWGGLPSVTMLRHRDPEIERPTKSRYHAKLQSAVEGVNIPNADQERANPDAADEEYRSCCRFLLRHTRDDKAFPHVKEENMDYGFRRNLYGLKIYGIIFSLAGILLCVLKLHRAHWNVATVGPLVLFCTAACVLALLVWLAFVNKEFVRTRAKAYAIRLFEAIETL